MERFLIGILVALSATAGLFFLRFWRDTRDRLFLAFAVFFLVESGNRCYQFMLENPNEGAPAIYVLRLVTVVIILLAIYQKNVRRS